MYQTAGPARCSYPHEGPHNVVLCPQCGEIIVLSRLPRDGSRLVRWPIALLLLAWLFAMFLLRHQGSQWPAYIFASLGLVNLLSLVASKGATLRTVAVATVLAVASWGVWWGSVVKPREDQVAWHWAPIALWAVSVVYAVILGSQTSSGADNRFTRFNALILSMTVLVLGMWGVLAADIEFGFGYAWLPGSALAVVTAAPLVALVIDVVQAKLADGISAALAAALAVVSAYLTVLQAIVEALNHAEQTIPARILGLPAAHWPDPGWFSLLPWKTVLSTGFAVAGAVILVASSIAEVGQQFAAHKPAYFLSQIQDATNRLTARPNTAARVSEHVYVATLRLCRAVSLTAMFAGAVVAEIAVRLGRLAVRMALALYMAFRQLVLPLICISGAALLLLRASRGTAAYAAGNSFTDVLGTGSSSPSSIWGATLWAALLVLVLCGLSFALNAAPPDPRPSTLGMLLPSALVASVCYALLTLGTVLFWPVEYALRQVHVSTTGLGFGPLTRLNLVMVLLCAGLVVVPVIVSEALSRTRSASAASEPSPRVVIASLTVALTASGGFAAFAGLSLITAWIKTVV